MGGMGGMEGSLLQKRRNWAEKTAILSSLMPLPCKPDVRGARTLHHLPRFVPSDHERLPRRELFLTKVCASDLVGHASGERWGQDNYRLEEGASNISVHPILQRERGKGQEMHQGGGSKMCRASLSPEDEAARCLKKCNP